MANATYEIEMGRVGAAGTVHHLPLSSVQFYKGTLVAQLLASGLLVPASTALSGPAIGKIQHDILGDGTNRGYVESNCVYRMSYGSGANAFSEATPIGSPAYAFDDHTVYATDVGGTLKLAGIFVGMEQDSEAKARIYVGAQGYNSLYAGLLSAQKTIPIPLTGAIDIATGALLAVFANGVSTTPGTQFTDSKTACIRWNNDAAPGAFAVNVPMPQDLDDTADMTFHALVSKTGATLADATSLTVGAFEHTVAALHDADSDFGGATNAVTGNATAKTVTELIRTFAAADIHAAPSSICLTVKPTAGLLGTDDFLIHSMWIEYKAKILST